jgi:hypothetical protein
MCRRSPRRLHPRLVSPELDKQSHGNLILIRTYVAVLVLIKVMQSVQKSKINLILPNMFLRTYTETFCKGIAHKIRNKDRLYCKCNENDYDKCS